MRRLSILSIIRHIGFIKRYGTANEFTLVRRQRQSFGQFKGRHYAPVDLKKENAILARIYTPFIEEDLEEEYQKYAVLPLNLCMAVAHIKRGTVMAVDDIQVMGETLKDYEGNAECLTEF